MRPFKLITLLAFTLLFICCDKDKTVDPQATDPNTANSFSCYVNGVYWEAQAPFTWGGAMAVSGELNVELSKFKLVGTKKNNDKEYFETITFFSDLSNSGTYPMTANHDKVMGYRDYYEKNCFIYYYDTLNSGTLNISTLDKNKRIIQGTFSMTLKNPDYGADSLMHITSGKFMFNY